jgi:hypothetical protein
VAGVLVVAPGSVTWKRVGEAPGFELEFSLNEFVLFCESATCALEVLVNGASVECGVNGRPDVDVLRGDDPHDVDSGFTERKR